MATFRELLLTLQDLSDEQLRQEVMIIPTGYCSEVPVDIDGFSPFSGKIELAISKGDIIFVEKLEAEAGSTVTLDRVLALSDGDSFKVGSPVLEGAKVTANVVKNGKGKKIYVMTYKPKKNEKKKNGHRQPYTKLQITKIEG